MHKRAAIVPDSAISFVVPGPIGFKERLRVDRRTGRLYTPNDTLKWERVVAQIAALHFRRPFVGPVCLTMIATYRPTPSWPAYLKEAAYMGPHMAKPDLSNIRKSVEDALNGIAYSDDAMIAESADRKRIGLVEELRVTVYPIGSEAFRAAWSRYGWPGEKPADRDARRAREAPNG